MPIAAAMAQARAGGCWAACALGVLAEHLGVVPERELDLPASRASTSRGDRAEVAALARWRRRRCCARAVLVVDVRSASARCATSATSPSRTCPPSGVSISRFSMSSRLCAGLGRAPDADVVGLAVAEDVADLLAGDQGGRRRGGRRPA